MKSHIPKPRMPGGANRIILRRTAVLMALFGVLVFVPLAGKLIQLQILRHEELGRMAADNQTRTSSITPARGTIYDRNMNVLAVSADVENVCIDPNELALSGQDTDAIAESLSSLLNVDKGWILQRMEDTGYRYQIVKRKVEQEEASAVRAYIARQNITGVYLEPDTKRYYPEGTLAAQLLGFVGSDNTGLDGVEAAWDEALTGAAGRIISAKGNYGSAMPYHHETYYDPVRGSSLVLTIDETVQQMLEKEGRLPDAVLACVGGGSNAIGSFYNFIEDEGVQLIGCEAAGRGVNTAQTAATIATGRLGIFHGMKSYFCQNEYGQIAPVYSISAGLDYPGIGPEHAYLHDIGRAKYVPVTDEEAVDAFEYLARTEGIIPAIESAHAVAYARKIVPGMGKDKIVVITISGRGDKDCAAIARYRGEDIYE